MQVIALHVADHLAGQVQLVQVAAAVTKGAFDALQRQLAVVSRPFAEVEELVIKDL
ncbi:hypothetical protein [Pseudomonas fluorescens]|uniref:hypothetical protein n=1 Tax=Pseudomonas fluorescens TaxID=294 RepID=UPI001781CD88|nr:hypothetical protein [Pseudomonas fluorescens]